MTAYDRELPAGEHVLELTSPNPGKHVVRVYVDDFLIETLMIHFE